jgi:hypothetical protein
MEAIIITTAIIACGWFLSKYSRAMTQRDIYNKDIARLLKIQRKIDKGINL